MVTEASFLIVSSSMFSKCYGTSLVTGIRSICHFLQGDSQPAAGGAAIFLAPNSWSICSRAAGLPSAILSRSMIVFT